MVLKVGLLHSDSRVIGCTLRVAGRVCSCSLGLAAVTRMFPSEPLVPKVLAHCSKVTSRAPLWRRVPGWWLIDHVSARAGVELPVPGRGL